MSQLTEKEWQDLVKEYYDEHGMNVFYVHEWVDGITPVYYSHIMEQFDEFNYEITEEHVGLEIGKVMQRTIYYQLYGKFVQKLHEYDNRDIDEEE
tara:strand:+ start:525 stop:809 length:285 start_codon:yes stop_codon:yes gene_type:complete